MILVLLFVLCSFALAGDFDPPTPRLSVLKPARKLDLAPGGQARLEMMGANLELFRYGQVVRAKQNIRLFQVRLADPSRDGTLRSLTVEAAPEAEPGLYELRLFTPRTSVTVPVDVWVTAP